jgi:hypothetical protein
MGRPFDSRLLPAEQPPPNHVRLDAGGPKSASRPLISVTGEREQTPSRHLNKFKEVAVF